MSYKSNDARDAEGWMSLPDVVDHISRTDKCSKAEAQRQLVSALVDGSLGPLRWKPEKVDMKRPYGSSPIIIPDDVPGTGHDWSTVKIDWKTGRVKNLWSEHRFESARIPLIRRTFIEHVWPQSAKATRLASVSNAIDHAIDTLFANGVPIGTTSKQRDNMVLEWVEKTFDLHPSIRAIQRRFEVRRAR